MKSADASYRFNQHTDGDHDHGRGGPGGGRLLAMERRESACRPSSLSFSLEVPASGTLKRATAIDHNLTPGNAKDRRAGKPLTPTPAESAALHRCPTATHFLDAAQCACRFWGVHFVDQEFGLLLLRCVDGTPLCRVRPVASPSSSWQSAGHWHSAPRDAGTPDARRSRSGCHSGLGTDKKSDHKNEGRASPLPRR